MYHLLFSILRELNRTHEHEETRCLLPSNRLLRLALPRDDDIIFFFFHAKKKKHVLLGERVVVSSLERNRIEYTSLGASTSTFSRQVALFSVYFSANITRSVTTRETVMSPETTQKS